MRKTVLISALLVASVAMPALADDAYYDNASVLSVAPQTERVNMPRQECSTEYIREGYTSNDRSPLGAIIGGVAGGIIGSQIGKGGGRVAAGAIGAGVGAVVGDRIGNNPTTDYATRPVDRCVTVDNWQTVNRGYLVTYRYNGRDYTTLADRDPGPTIRVRVNVAAADSYNQSSYDDQAYISRAEPVPVYPAREDWRLGPRQYRNYW